MKATETISKRSACDSRWPKILKAAVHAGLAPEEFDFTHWHASWMACSFAAPFSFFGRRAARLVVGDYVDNERLRKMEQPIARNIRSLERLDT